MAHICAQLRLVFIQVMSTARDHHLQSVSKSPSAKRARLIALAIAGTGLLSACSATGDEEGIGLPADSTAVVEEASENADSAAESDETSDSDQTDTDSADDPSPDGSESNGSESNGADPTGTEPDAETPPDLGDADLSPEEADQLLSLGDPADDGFEEVDDVFPIPEDTPIEDTEIIEDASEVVPEVAEQLSEISVDDGEEVLDAVEVVDAKAPVATQRDGRTRNSSGELAVLDSAASLACGQTEVALTLLDEGNAADAAQQISSAAEQAGTSGIESIRSWESPLAALAADGSVGDLAPLIGFISVCAEGGYEL